MKSNLLLIIVSCFLFVGLAGSSIYALSTRSNLVEREKEIETVEAKLQETDQILQEKEATLTDTKKVLSQTETKQSLTQEALTITQNNLEVTKRELITTLGGLLSTQNELTSNQAKLASTEAVLTVAKDNLATTQNELTFTETELANTKGELSSTTNKLISLEREMGTIRDLQSRKQELENNIGELEKTRQALIPKTQNVSFSCTGSMNPKITCMDTAVYLANPMPGDIVIGAVISFNNPETGLTRYSIGGGSQTESLYGCGVTGRISHRVVDIKVEAGQYYYRTKGDNNDADDGCWLPFNALNGYLIELKKGSDPVMESLLSQIWKEDAEIKRLKTGMVSRQTTYDSLLAAYRELCPYYNCTLAEPDFSRAVAMERDMESNRLDYNEMLTRYKFLLADIDSMRDKLEGHRCSRLEICG